MACIEPNLILSHACNNMRKNIITLAEWYENRDHLRRLYLNWLYKRKWKNGKMR